MNIGTWTTAPVERVPRLVAFDFVSPLTAGSHSVIWSSTKFGSSIEIGRPL